MAYVDLNTAHNPATGTVAPAAWGDQVRDNLEFLVDPPACSVFHSAAVGTTNATILNLLANSENFDNNAMHSTVSNTDRITAQTAGRYLFFCTVTFAANATGARLVQFQKNGVTAFNMAHSAPTPSGRDTDLSGVRAIDMAVGDYVVVQARQDSGGALNVTLKEFGAAYLTR